MIELNAAVALAMVEGSEAGLAWIDQIEARGGLDQYHLLHAARAELLRDLGRSSDAVASYGRALDTVGNGAERRWLTRRLHECREHGHDLSRRRGTLDVSGNGEYGAAKREEEPCLR